MAIMATAGNGKKFEKPDSGMFHGVLADIVDLGLVKTTYQGVEKEQPMVRFVWILDKNGADGQPLSVAKRYNLVLHEKSNLYKDVKMILNAAPPIPYDIEQLIGSTRQLLIIKEASKDGTKEYANIQGIAPAAPGIAVAIPANFVRAKYRTKQANAPAQAAVATGAPAGTVAPTAAGEQGADVEF